MDSNKHSYCGRTSGLTTIAGRILRWTLILLSIGFAILLIDSIAGAQSSAMGQVISSEQVISGNGQSNEFNLTSTLAEQEPTLAEADRIALVKRIQQAIVIVTAPDGGIGQGVVISRKPGLIATAAHVIPITPLGNAIKTRFSNNVETNNGRLVRSDFDMDVAIYETEIPEGIEPVEVIGLPQANEVEVKEQNTIGIFGRDRVLFKPISMIHNGIIYADAKLHPGDSGGPVIDTATGKLVGVISGGWFWIDRDKDGKAATWPARLGSGKRVRELRELVK